MPEVSDSTSTITRQATTYQRPPQRVYPIPAAIINPNWTPAQQAAAYAACTAYASQTAAMASQAALAGHAAALAASAHLRPIRSTISHTYAAPARPSAFINTSTTHWRSDQGKSSESWRTHSSDLHHAHSLSSTGPGSASWTQGINKLLSSPSTSWLVQSPNITGALPICTPCMHSSCIQIMLHPRAATAHSTHDMHKHTCSQTNIRSYR